MELVSLYTQPAVAIIRVALVLRKCISDSSSKDSTAGPISVAGGELRRAWDPPGSRVRFTHPGRQSRQQRPVLLHFSSSTSPVPRRPLVLDFLELTRLPCPPASFSSLFPPCTSGHLPSDLFARLIHSKPCLARPRARRFGCREILLLFFVRPACVVVRIPPSSAGVYLVF